MNESGKGVAEYHRDVWSRKSSGAIRSLVNAESLQLECAMVLLEALLVSLFILWKQMENHGSGMCRWTTLEVL